MKKKIYKVRLEKNEYRAVKIISCSNNIKIHDLLKVIILTFIEYQENNEKPIKRKSSFLDAKILNVPISQDTHDKILKHRSEEGVSSSTILNNSVTHWLKLMKIDVDKVEPSITKDQIFNATSK